MNSVAAGEEELEHHAFRPRLYQIEMFEESLLRNIVIAMPTGSGKTLIAIMRAQYALEKGTKDNLVWFCAPKVQLARQQYDKISAQLPMFKSVLLTGVDGCESWTKSMWEQVLESTRVIVSTFDILREALGHAFVKMDRLCLLIFDEAHHAMKKHSANKIMQGFYHTIPDTKRPDFLGLTATPVNEIGNLNDLEGNLSAICRTPTSTREALDQHIHVPTFLKIPYKISAGDRISSESVMSVAWVLQNLDFHEDPWVIRMKSHPETANSYALLKAERTGRTFTREQVNSLYIKSEIVANELGPWLADIYVYQCVTKFLEANEDEMSLFNEMEDDELSYLKAKLASVRALTSEQLEFSSECHISDKGLALVDFLSAQQPSQLRCLLFAKTRAQVAMLAYLLTVHPHTSKFLSASFVGETSYPSRKRSLAELVDVKQQKDALENLESGAIQIIIATEALEEGIDIVNCNTVICFDTPTNLRSFVQRRGRASRKAASRFAILCEADEDIDKSVQWTELDRIMTERFQNQGREVENFEQDAELDYRVLQHPETGYWDTILCNEKSAKELAKIEAADAVGHLYHFCSHLTRDPFVNPSPAFDYDVVEIDSKNRSYRCKVRLPNTLQPDLRAFEGSSWWPSEKAARRDCAFITYQALFEAGLLNDHLLARDVWDETERAALQAVEIRPAVAMVSDQTSMWHDLACIKRSNVDDCYALSLSICHSGETLEMSALTNAPLPLIQSFNLFWDVETVFSVKCMTNSTPSSVPASTADETTNILLSAAFSGRIPSVNDFLIKFVPSLRREDCMAFTNSFTGSTRASDWQLERIDQLGILRDMSRSGMPFIFRGYQCQSKDDLFGAHDQEMMGGTEENYIHEITPAEPQILHSFESENLLNREYFVLFDVEKFPKRRDFLHQESVPWLKPATETILADYCWVDNLPFRFARFGTFIPAIMHKIHIALIVEHLCSTILLPLGRLDTEMVRSAILTRAAREDSNYERLEFLGDSILKFCTSLMLFTTYLTYPESTLSRLKDHVVSNASLAKAAIESGLDKFIITKAFSGSKWSPPCKDDFSKVQPAAQREMSTKTLADVVEALVGAAFLNGDYRKAIACLQLFLPQQPWNSTASAFDTLAKVYQGRPQPQAVVEIAEQIVKHTFNYKALLAESVCHASHQEPGSWAPYERLEFLGDAVLDNIVTVAAHARQPPLSVKQLHLIRTALVNADFLGYLCLQYGIESMESIHVVHDPMNVEIREHKRSIKLWQLLRFASPTIRVAIEGCRRRFESLETPIAQALKNDSQYPWTLLAQLDPPKPLSDIVEAILGAIYIDTSGSMPDCQIFLERIGLMSYLQHVLESDSMNLFHPKEELGQLADSDTVQYVMAKEEEGGKKSLSCKVIVGERELASVTGGRTPLETQTRAAEIAREVLRKERMETELDSEESVETSGDEAVSDESMIDGGVLLRAEDDETGTHNGMNNNDVNNEDSDDYMTADE